VGTSHAQACNSVSSCASPVACCLPSLATLREDAVDHAAAQRRVGQPATISITTFPSDAATGTKAPPWSERPLDRSLVLISLCAVTALGMLEVGSGPQLATRIVLSMCYQLAVRTGLPPLYDLPSSWRGWYSLEIGVEITTAITLGFLVWLLFALVYDAAGILVGLVPSSVTSIVTLTFRFHLHSYALLIAVPAVIIQAVIAARILDRRWYDQEAERTLRRTLKQAAAANLRSRSKGRMKSGSARSLHESGVVSGGGAYFRSSSDSPTERRLLARGRSGEDFFEDPL